MKPTPIWDAVGSNLLDSCSPWPHNIWAVTGLFAIFLLLSACAYATRTETGRASATNTSAALTTNHLPLKGDPGLVTSVHVPTRDANETASLKSKARSLKASNSCPLKADTQLGSCSKTERISASTLNRTSHFPLICRTGKPKITSRSSDCEPFTVSDFYNLEPDRPASLRVLSSGHAVTGLGLTHFMVLGRAFRKEADVRINASRNLRIIPKTITSLAFSSEYVSILHASKQPQYSFSGFYFLHRWRIQIPADRSPSSRGKNIANLLASRFYEIWRWKREFVFSLQYFCEVICIQDYRRTVSEISICPANRTSLSVECVTWMLLSSIIIQARSLAQ
jgi:hypothetical protein